MNKGTGRKVFNKARGCLMLVAETAKGQGKDSGQGTTGAAGAAGASNANGSALKGPSFTVKAVNTVALSVMLTQTLLTPIQAVAQIRADNRAPGAERPTVLTTANGLPQVNITTPSAAGVSRNQMSQMDVDSRGAVVNNSRTNTTTQLGGWVQGNPWLGQGEARVILLQVNSNDPSQINGFIEIAGQRSEIVIANPAGLNVNGSGFINASRATLTTGEVQMSGGDLQSYSVGGGKITIGSQGFDASLTDYTGILARAVEINGPLHAKDLQVVTGANQIDAQHHDRVSAAPATEGRPSFSIDVSRLGGMYAGKITLIGTDAGVGVRNAGSVQAGAKGLTLNAQGDLVNTGALGASGDASIQVKGRVDNSGTLFADGNAILKAGQDIANEGTIRAGGNLDVTTPGRLDNPGFITSGGSMTAQATHIDNSGVLTAGGSATLVATETIDNSGYMSAGDTLTIDANQVHNSGMLNAGGLLDLKSRTRFDNEGSVIVEGSVQISAPQGISNAGSIESHHDVRLVTEQEFTNAGDVVADGAINVQARTEVINDGYMSADKGVTIARPDVFVNAGQIFSGAQIDVEAGERIDNPGFMVADGSLRLDAGQTVTNAGQAYAVAGASVTAGQQIQVDGLLAAGDDLSLQTLNAEGQIDASSAAVVAAGMDADGYVVLGHGALSANAGESASGKVSFQGSTLAGERFQAKAGSVDVHDQTIVSGAIDIDATEGTVEANNTALQAVGKLRLSASGDLNTDASDVGGQQVDITAQNWHAKDALVTQSGVEDGDARFAVAGAVDASGAVIQANAANVAIEAQSVDLQGGYLIHSGAGELKLAGSDASGSGSGSGSGPGINITDAVVSTAGKLSITGASLEADRADVSASGQLAMAITGDATSVDASLSAGTSLNAKVGAWDASGASVIAQQNAKLEVNGELKATGALLAANETTDIAAGSLSAREAQVAGVSGGVQLNVVGAADLHGGSLQSEGDVNISTQGATDVGEGQVFGKNIAIDTHGGALGNAQGVIIGVEGVAIQSGAIDSQQGVIQAGSDLTITVSGDASAGLNSQGGQILAANTATLSVAGTIDSSAYDDGTTVTRGVIAANDQLDITAGGLLNRGSDIKSAGQVTLDIAGGTLDNSDNGLIASSEVLSITAGTVRNVDTKIKNPDDSVEINGIQAKTVAITTGDLDNTRGGIIATEGLDIVASGQLTNTDGLISSGSTLSIKDPQADPAGETNVATKTLNVVNGADGLIVSNGQLTIDASAMTQGGVVANAGRVVEVEDAASPTGTSEAIEDGNTRVMVSGSFTSTEGSVMQSAQNLDVFSSGSINNAGTLESSQVTSVVGSSVTNQSTGALRGGAVDLRGGSITNRGLVNGNLTLIQAGTLNNLGTGRIYGDHVVIAAGGVTNAASGGKSPVIASREDLDLAVGSFVNKDGALLMALGDMRVGGDLDDDYKAIGRAGSFVNSSAEVDVFGNVTINAGSVANVDGHGESYSRTTVQDVLEYLVYDENDTYYTDQPHPYSMVPLDGTLGTMDWRWDETSQKYAYYVPNDGSDEIAGRWWWIDNYTRTITESGTFGSDPAQFSVGGNLSINAGSTVNDKSSIIVGGNLTVRGGDLQNISGYKSRTVDEVGTRQLSYTELGWFRFHWTHRRYMDAPVERVFVQQTQYEEIPSTVKFRTAPNHGARRPGAAATVEVDSQTQAQTADTSATANANPDAPSAHLGRPGPGVVVRTMPGGVASSASVSGTGATGASSVVPSAGHVALPSNALFQVRVGAPAGYLVETDPEFTMERRWLGSDFMLEQLGYDPATVTQRLGDGFYEQKLVREQVAQLTGRRFLGTFTDDEAQYRALLEAGAAFAEAYQLKPGIALTSAQMAALTSDIVWLVEKDVTLPDGKVQRVLVPQLYALVNKNTGSQQQGLISAKKIDMQLSGNVFNTGALAAKDNLKISAANITNILGSLQGKNIDLRASGGLTSILGKIAAERNLRMRSGGDTVIIGGAISAGGSARLSAGGNFSLLAYDTGRRIFAQSAEGSKGPKFKMEDSTFNQTGTKLDIGGGLSIRAGGDIVAQGVQGNIGGGASLHAGGNVSVSTAVKGHVQSLDLKHKYSTMGGLTNVTVEDTRRDIDITNSGNTWNVGGAMNIVAGGDIDISGAQIKSSGYNAQAGGNYTERAAYDTKEKISIHSEKLSGIGPRLMLGLGSQLGEITTNERITDIDSTRTAIVTNINAGNGTVTRSAGGDALVEGTVIRGGTVNPLTAGGHITAVGAMDTRQVEHTVSTSTQVWQSTRSQGSMQQTLHLPEIHGTLPAGVSAYQGAGGVTVQLPESSSVRQTVERLSKEQGTSYLGSLAGRSDINWQEVEAVTDTWDYKKEGLTQEAAIVVAIVVTIFTAGIASEAGFAVASAAELTTTTAAGSVVLTSTGVAVSGAVAAGVSSLAATAAVSLINNKGDIGAVLDELGSSENVRGLLLTMATAGISQGILNNIPMEGVGGLPPSTLANANANSTVGQLLARNAVQGITGAVLESAIMGTDLEDALVNNLRTAVINTFAAQGADAIGDAHLDQVSKAMAHALLGCAVGTATADSSGGCAAGAVGGVMGELMAGWYGNSQGLGDLEEKLKNDPTNQELLKQISDIRSNVINLAKLTAAGSAYLLGGDSGDMTLAMGTGSNAAENNFLTHQESSVRLRLREALQSCEDTACRDEIRTEIIRLDQLDSWRDAQIEEACRNPASTACQSWARAIQYAASTYKGQSGNYVDTAERSSVLNKAFEYQQATDNPFLYGVGKGLLKLTPPGMLVLGGAGVAATAESLWKNGATQTVVEAVKGIADIPAELKARLASDDPSVRGEAFIDVLSLASGAGISVAGGTRVVLNQAERLKLNATITQAEQVAIARTKIENSFNAENDAWSNKPSGLNETTPVKDTFGRAPNDSDLATHLSIGGPSTQKGVFGAHSEAAYQAELTSIRGIEISKTEIAPGVWERQYNTPDRVAANKDPLTKTTYDSRWSDRQILEMSKQASSQVWTEFQRTGVQPSLKGVTTEINGIPFVTMFSKDKLGNIAVYSHPGKAKP